MTKELLNRIAKMKNIDLALYDHVYATVSEDYKWVYCSVWAHESVGGHINRAGEKRFKLSVMSILKREQELPEEYETPWQGSWIYELK